MANESMGRLAKEQREEVHKREEVHMREDSGNFEIAPWAKFEEIKTKTKLRKPFKRTRKKGYRYFRGTMPELLKYCSRNVWLYWVSTILRSIGMLMFVSSPILGLCVLIGFLMDDLWGTATLLVAVISANMTAKLINLDKTTIQSGLFGYNAALIGRVIPLIYEYREDWLWNTRILIFTVFLASFSVILFISLGQIFVNRLNVSVQVMPAVIMLYVAKLGGLYFGYLPSNGVPQLRVPVANFERGEIDMTRLSESWILGLLYISVISNLYSFIPIVIGYLIVSPLTLCYTMYGSLIAILTGLAVGIPSDVIYDGSWNYYGSLSIGVMGSLYFVPTYHSLILVTMGAISSCMMSACVDAIMIPFGTTGSSMGVMFIAFIFQLTPWNLDNIVPVSLSSITTPEDHLNRYRLSRFILSKFGIIRSIAKSMKVLPSSPEDMNKIERSLLPILLCYIASKGNLKELKKIVNFGADPNLHDYDGRTALHLASCNGHLKLVNYLISVGANVNVRDNLGNTPLFDAFRHDNIECEKLLYNKGALLDIEKNRLGSLLCKTSAKNDIYDMKRLVDLGANINASDYDDRTALHLAICEKHNDLAKYLIECGADTSAVDRYGNTPIDDAKSHGNCEILDRIGHTNVSDQVIDIEEGVKLSRRNHFSDLDFIKAIVKGILSSDNEISQKAILPAVLCSAATIGDISIFDIIYDRFNHIEYTDYDGRTPLHIASLNGNLVLVRYLLKRGVDPQCEDRWGVTPLLEACLNGHEDIADLLVEKGCRLENITERLCWLVQNEDIDKLKIFLRYVEDVNIGDYDHRTPLHIAKDNDNKEIHTLLISHGADPSILDRWHK